MKLISFSFIYFFLNFKVKRPFFISRSSLQQTTLTCVDWVIQRRKLMDGEVEEEEDEEENEEEENKEGGEDGEEEEEEEEEEEKEDDDEDEKKSDENDDDDFMK